MEYALLIFTPGSCSSGVAQHWSSLKTEANILQSINTPLGSMTQTHCRQAKQGKCIRSSFDSGRDPLSRLRLIPARPHSGGL
jgi:hypothetical protein